ncbi:MAG TPA: sulfite exporter TauE/SafE family protein, partial [Chondromyces sp.]|nr:sulfite exporter TauE/SafE family protein [Chondromyces sp.]
GFIAGFFDASGGGGWGPIATPALLSQKGMVPRKVIGTVNTSEFAIAVSATAGFMISLGPSKVNWLWAGAIMLGGVIAAPIAAWVVKHMPTKIMAVIVSGMMIFTNVKAIFSYTTISNSIANIVYGSIAVIWIFIIYYVIQKNKKIAEQKEKTNNIKAVKKTS